MADRKKTILIYLGNSFLFTLFYTIAILIGISITRTQEQAIPVWLPIGISIALVYLWGYRYLPVYLLIYLFGSILTGQPLMVSIPMALASTLACYLTVLLLKRSLKINPGLTSLKDVLGLQLIGMLAPLIPTAVAALANLAAGVIDASEVPSFMLALWAGDLLGIMLVMPVLLVWSTIILKTSHLPNKNWDWFILILVVFVTWWIFHQEANSPVYFGSLSYLVYPFLFWIAYRLHQPGATLANLCVCLMALFTAYNEAQINLTTPAIDIIMLEIFTLTIILTSLTLAALFTERDEANQNLKEFTINLEERIDQRTRALKDLNEQLNQELHARHTVEKELRVSQQNLRTIIDNISDAIVIVDPEGKVVDLNDNVLSLFSVSREKAMHEYDLIDFSSPKESQRILDAYFLRALNGENVSFDWTGRRPTDNTTFDIEVTMKRIRMNNQPLVVVSIRDLSERKRIEAAEHEQRVLAEALQNTAAALSSIQNLDEVFDKILKNVGKVVPHDAVNLMLIEDGVGRIVHHHGYKKLGMLDYIRDIRFEVSKTPTLRSMIESANPIIIPNVSKFPEWVLPAGIKWIKSYAGAPIRIRGAVIGFLQLDSGTPDFFKKEHSDRLQTFADQAAVAIDNARLYMELQKLATTDPLTGLLNRHGFNGPSKREFVIARRYSRKLSAILFDIDHLKNINDLFGHPVGDLALNMISQCCRSTIREIDLAARYGGDEFIILLPESDLVSGMEVAGRLKQCIHSNSFNVDGTPVPVTISAGVAELKRGMRNLDELIDMADRGSYLAKSQGRDSIATVQSLTRRPRNRKSSM